MGKRITLLASLVLAVLLCLLLGQAAAKDRAEQARMEDLNRRTAAYQQELDEILKAVLAKEMAIREQREAGTVLVGYQIETLEDLELAAQHRAEQGFCPVIVLEYNAPAAWFEAARARDFAVVVTAQPFDAAALAQANAQLRARWFLLRSVDDSAEKLQALTDCGFDGCFRFPEAAENTVLESGLGCLNYGYVSQKSQTVGEALDALTISRGTMLIVFDMDSYHAGTLEEEHILDSLELISQAVKNGVLRWSEPDAAMEELFRGFAAEEVRRAEYVAFEASQLQRIEELRQKIDAVYQEWAAEQEK